MVKPAICSYWLQIERLVILLMVYPALLSGCVQDGFIDCRLNVDLFIKLQVDSDGTRSAHEIKNVTAYIFDDMRVLESIIDVDIADIIGNRPLKLEYWMSKPPTVVVWVNFNGTEQLPSLAIGTPLSEAWIRMGGTMDNALPTGDLFHGIKRLNADPVQEIVATSYVGQISITARGFDNLLEIAPNLFFTLSTPYNGYDFTGIPLSGNTIVKSEGVIGRNNADFVTPEPINLTLFPDHYSTGEAVKIELRINTGSESILIAEALQDIHGQYVIPQAGRNTNVLLKVTEQGFIEIVVKVTEWNTVEQWVDW